MAQLGRKFVDLVKWHWTDVTLVRSEKQLEREKFLFGCIPFNRWFMVVPAVLVQLCLGSLYSWSVYNVPIEESLGLSAGTAANVFYVAVGFFGFSAAIVGPILERKGPLPILIFSTIMLFIGYMLSALGAWQKQMWLIFVGYGMFAGIGLGSGYITPVSPLQKWFPDYKGLCSGLAVCGFGGGSMIASKVEAVCISKYGVPLTFVILGVSYFIVMTFCWFFIRCPPPGYYIESPEERKRREEHEEFVRLYGETGNSVTLVSNAPAGSAVETSKKTDSVVQAVPEAAIDVAAPSQNFVNAEGLREPDMTYTLPQAIFNRDYACMYITLIGNSVAGLMILSKMSDIMQQQFGQSKTFGANIVLINSGFNLLGRLLYGAISDRIGQKPIFVVSLFSQAIIMGLLPVYIHNGEMWLFIASIWILAMFYGAGFGLMPAFLTGMFGSSNIGALHGIILTGWSIVGIVGGLTFTAIFKNQVAYYGTKKSPYVYDINFWTIAGFVSLVFFVCIMIRTSMKDRLLPRQKGEILKVPFFGRPLVFGYKTKGTQAREWADYLRTLPINQGYEAPAGTGSTTNAQLRSVDDA